MPQRTLHVFASYRQTMFRVLYGSRGLQLAPSMVQAIEKRGSAAFLALVKTSLMKTAQEVAAWLKVSKLVTLRQALLRHAPAALSITGVASHTHSSVHTAPDSAVSITGFCRSGGAVRIFLSS